jgi:hypothetical protein
LQISLKSQEFTSAELVADSSVKSLLVESTGGGRITLDVQASRDGMTWGTPVASARLVDAAERNLDLDLPEGVRRIRALLHNYGEPATVSLTI